MAVTGLTAIAYQRPGFVEDRILKVNGFTGTYTAGGDTIDLTTVVEGKWDGFNNFSFRAILAAYPLNDVGGYYFELIPGTTKANYKLKIFAPAGTEITGGAAYPGALTTAIASNPILLEVTTQKGI